MTDQINNQSESSHDKPSEAERRIKELSEKVELTARERDEKNTLIGERDKEIVGLKKENEFHSQFSDILSNHPEAKNFKDVIKEKVSKGYSVEDATFAVLGKEGKLGTKPSEQVNPAGGSADTAISSNADKPVSEMSLAEKRAKLEKTLVIE